MKTNIKHESLEAVHTHTHTQYLYKSGIRLFDSCLNEIGLICDEKKYKEKIVAYTRNCKEGKQLNIIIEKRIGNSLQVLLRKIIQLSTYLSFLCMKDKYA